MKKPYRIIIADDHSLIRKGIKSIIAQTRDMEVVAEAADGIELLEQIAQHQPDMVILDISMPRMNGIETVSVVRERFDDVRILILTMHSQAQYFYQTISSGAHGYLLKDDSDTELCAAIETVQQGRIYISPQLVTEVSGEMVSVIRDQKESPLVRLTNREKQVLQLVVKGQTSKQMAEALCLSPRTIDHHRASLLKKFKMKKTVDLVNHVVRNSIIVPE
ncbi:MAG: DNA-binding response regulator [Desulfobulbus sp.]|nr:MAG: DNA-binding response regulator [Desulfobulbus sp.]RUM36391.1 MAG: DNA-binding response regulator [Desulfobulbus sp.]